MLFHYSYTVTSCGRPQIPRGAWISGKDYTVNNTIVYSCGPLYNLIGGKTRKCLANGSWSGKTPKCKPSKIHVSDIFPMRFLIRN